MVHGQGVCGALLVLGGQGLRGFGRNGAIFADRGLALRPLRIDRAGAQPLNAAQTAISRTQHDLWPQTP